MSDILKIKNGNEWQGLSVIKGDKGDKGTTDYNDLTNKPTIPSTASDIGAMDASDYTTETWTFTLSDNSTVTKNVVVGVE